MEQQPIPLPASTPLYEDGLYRFRVRRQDGKITDEQIDVLLLKLIIDRNDAKHLPDGVPRLATPEMMLDLAAEITQFGVPCSVSLAMQLWHAGLQAFRDLKKNMSEPQNSPTDSESNPAT